MPISVVCPGCKAHFSVSEKFAGKQGPCPKCKAVINVPNAPAPAPASEEIKIHEPEQFASGGKDSKGRAVSKPILRKETRLQPVAIAGMVAGAILVFAMAIALRFVSEKLPFVVAGLLIVSPPLAVAGYTFLRDDELMEPYRGRALLLRSSLCSLAYAALWGVYAPLPAYGIITGEAWQWLFVAPVFICAGAGVAYACLDLDFGSGAMHYCFYLLATLLLRFALGWPPLWAVATASS
ncbi:MAG: hypothetical protein HY288_19600 [Planctomycetia bacterium]|nr:hypothetical protein [Planctomycetia bacterium]